MNKRKSTDADRLSEAARLLGKRGKRGRRAVMLPCPKCGLVASAVVRRFACPEHVDPKIYGPRIDIPVTQK